MTQFDGTELVHWRELPPPQRRDWWEYVWDAAITLSGRYRLALRTGWWGDCVQVEVIAAFHAWLRLYDTGAYTDPPGKLQLLWELERLRGVVRGGENAFDPVADRRAFDVYVRSLDAGQSPEVVDDESRGGFACTHATADLNAVTQRISELRARARLLEDDLATCRPSRSDGRGMELELQRVEAAIEELDVREHSLRSRMDQDRGSAPSC